MVGIFPLVYDVMLWFGCIGALRPEKRDIFTFEGQLEEPGLDKDRRIIIADVSEFWRIEIH